MPPRCKKSRSATSSWGQLWVLWIQTGNGETAALQFTVSHEVKFVFSQKWEWPLLPADTCGLEQKACCVNCSLSCLISTEPAFPLGNSGTDLAGGFTAQEFQVPVTGAPELKGMEPCWDQPVPFSLPYFHPLCGTGAERMQRLINATTYFFPFCLCKHFVDVADLRILSPSLQYRCAPLSSATYFP